MNTVPIVSEEEYQQLFNENKKHFDKILEIVRNTGEILEGDCMYQDRTFNRKNDLIPKQRNLMSIARQCKRALEIGFNAGNSALTMLIANPRLVLDVIDICEHKYAKPCFQYVSTVFPGQLRLIEGSSVKVFDNISFQPYDMYHIDGGHANNIANTDFFNCRNHGRKGSIVIFDDVWIQWLRNLWNYYKKSKMVSEFVLLHTPMYSHGLGRFT